MEISSKCSCEEKAASIRKLALSQPESPTVIDLDAIFFSSLNEELVVEILLRLPRTESARYQLVCKRWYSLISSHYFIGRSIGSSPFNHTIVFQFEYNCKCSCNSPPCRPISHSSLKLFSSDRSLLLQVYGKHDIKLSYLPCPPQRLHKIRLVGAFADLILCYYYSTTPIPHTTLKKKQINYYVSNLLTRQWIPLRPVGDSRDDAAVGFLCLPPSSSESCNSRYNRFIVVRIPDVMRPTRPEVEVHVFSSEEGRWRRRFVSSPLPSRSYNISRPLVAYRGLLHWLKTDCIAVYDPLNSPKRFSRIIPLPTQSPDFPSEGTTGCFGICQDRIRVSRKTRVGTLVLHVWELEDYDSGLWKLVHKVVLQSILSQVSHFADDGWVGSRAFCVLYFDPKNGDDVYFSMCNSILCVDIKRGIIKHHRSICPAPASVWSWRNTFHLDNHWCPTHVSSFQH
ncbi:unnamed protein product [Cuscuta epithymum]|uniref:F-box domain-containing protein n=1 Tax=Cuscuta epithymum TaxID=186058 RepID=A0AAV0G585_9ASTE|nr:unnamed protein product [Cuscuta epithymum]CAH9143004.1 unnamed protein product [Cuscuta epithymum]